MPLPKKQKFLQEIVEPEKKIPEPVQEVEEIVEETPQVLQEIVSDAVVCEVCGGGECVCEDE
jgi:hypothetical protein